MGSFIDSNLDVELAHERIDDRAQITVVLLGDAALPLIRGAQAPDVGHRGQLINALLAQSTFDLPESAVANETKNVVYNIVQENTKRGVGRELIEKQKDEIYSAAAGTAKERVKLAFLIQRIAEKEAIQVSQEEVLQRIQSLAQAYQIPPDKFIKDLQKRNGINELFDQIAHEKVLTFLETNATITEVPAAAK